MMRADRRAQRPGKIEHHVACHDGAFASRSSFSMTASISQVWRGTFTKRASTA